MDNNVVWGRSGRTVLKFFFLAVFLARISVFGVQNVNLIWDPSPDSGVAGYNIYYGTTSHSYTNIVAVGNSTNCTVSGLVEGVTYYFAATAYNSSGLESDFSNEVSYKVPSNAPPTISSIAGQNVTWNSSTTNIVFTITDPDTPASGLSLSAASSNTGLVPVASIVFGGSGNSRTVRVTPTLNTSGSATITLTVSDGTNSASTTFVVTVLPNQTPTLNALNNLTINENAGLQTVNLSSISSGATNENQTLTVTATSSNTGLIPNPTVTYTSPNSTGTLTFTPVANAGGTAIITVKVNDGQTSNNTITRTFSVTVNYPPGITPIADQNIYANTNSSPVPFSVSDTETPAASLTVSGVSDNASLIPNGNLVFGGSGTNRTVTLTPVANQIGSAHITITVSDGLATASTTFKLTVTSRPPAPPTNLIIR